MRPPRLILFIFCVIFLPIFYTFFSALFSSPRVSTPNALAGRTSGLHALFSFNLPSSLFPPSAIISLTDDNSTFFLARPAAFGPSLAKEGLSGQLWVGSGFGEGGLVSGVEGELGCSDIPGWGDGGDAHYKQERPYGKSVSGTGKGATVSQNRHPRQESDSQNIANGGTSPPSKNDGTDDHLHHPLVESDMVNAGVSETSGDYAPTRPGTHADVQSLQEGAEIAGKVVLLSRGGCGFLEKVKWAQRRGGVAVIVGDNTRGGSLVTMYARVDTSNVTIPALFTSHTTAHLLSSLIPSQLSEEASRVEESKASRTKTSSQTTSSKYVDLMTTPSATPTPTPISNQAVDSPLDGSPKPKTGLFHSLLSLIGLGSTSGRSWHPPDDSRRPPSSGNIDWVVMDSWAQVESSVDYGRGGRAKSSDTKRYGSKMSGNADGDGFVIGVQDWRDPDLAPTRRSAFPSSSTAVGQETQKTQTKASKSTPTGLKGGSVTPGSGEYVDVEKSSYQTDSSLKNAGHQSSTADTRPGSPKSGKGWFSRHFGRASAEERSSESDSSPDLRERSYSVQGKQNTEDNSHPRNRQAIKSKDHEGLWVTLTPTSMSTSPFFDTLLVLVVSPLLTLSVVYALLLIRSRVRRRRWRAPKSVVDRLPIRTYHTISPPSSVASSPRSSIHDSSSPESPLLPTERRPGSPPSRPQSPVTSGSVQGQRRQRSKAEKSRSGSRLWRRKYTGRQVECVVCLEEYIDGQSRVMSLPCGHEFHAECM